MANLPEIATEMIEAAEFELSPEELAFLTTASNRWPEAWSQSASTLYASKLLGRALEEHANALIRSTETLKEQSAKLARATWVVAGATIVLAFFTCVLAISVVVSLLLG